MKIKVGNEEVILDQDNLNVDEVTLNDFLKKFAGKYNYYNGAWAKAQFFNQLAEDAYEVILNQKFAYYKELGGSDKLAESKSKSDVEVVKAKSRTRDTRYVMELLRTYLRSMDKAHDDALNLGYNMRKEMDKIFPSYIKGKLSENLDAQIEELMNNDDL